LAKFIEMNKHKKFLIHLSYILLILGCEESDLIHPIKNTKWLTVKIEKPDTTIATPEYFLEFNAEGFITNTDANTCEGRFQISDTDGIEFSDEFCTNKGGDSPLSLEVRDYILNAGHFELNRDSLRLRASEVDLILVRTRE